MIDAEQYVIRIDRFEGGAVSPQFNGWLYEGYGHEKGQLIRNLEGQFAGPIDEPT